MEHTRGYRDFNAPPMIDRSLVVGDIEANRKRSEYINLWLLYRCHSHSSTTDGHGRPHRYMWMDEEWVLVAGTEAIGRREIKNGCQRRLSYVVKKHTRLCLLNN